jgi:hypothetical protein
LLISPDATYAHSALAGRQPLDAVARLQRAVPYDFVVAGTAFYGKFGSLYPAWIRGEGVPCSRTRRRGSGRVFANQPFQHFYHFQNTGIEIRI